MLKFLLSTPLKYVQSHLLVLPNLQNSMTELEYFVMICIFNLVNGSNINETENRPYLTTIFTDLFYIRIYLLDISGKKNVRPINKMKEKLNLKSKARNKVCIYKLL